MDTAKIKIRWKYYQYFILLIFHLNKLSLCNETSTEVSYSVSSSSSTKVEIGGHIVTSNTNETREALSHDASQHDSVVFISDTSGYVPLPSIGRRGHGRPPPTPPASSEEEFDYRQPPWDKDAWNRDTWDREYRKFRFNNTRVQQIDAICQDDYMQIRVGFNNSFTGMIYSAGYAYDPDCMYVNGTGRDYYEFAIELNRCGTLGKNLHHDDRRQPSKNFMWNTITVQYNPLIEEEFDEHFKVTCEYGYDYWKTVTFPFLDVEKKGKKPRKNNDESKKLAKN